MNVLHQRTTARGVLTGLVPDPTPYAAMLRPAQDAKFGDFQANFATSLGKLLAYYCARWRR